jgi:paraquat-inducible protein B
VVALEFVRNAPPATVTKEGDDFVIPAVEGAGFATLTSSATDVLNKVNTIPFDQIGRDLGGILEGLNDTFHDPQTKKALTQLAATITSVQEVTGNLNKGSAPLLKRLPEIAANLQDALNNANKAILSFNGGYGDNTQFNRDLDRLLVQVNDATRSIRALADLLARHPEVLVKGRPNGGAPE